MSSSACGRTCAATYCIMFSRNDAGLCAVWRRAIERVIGLYAH